MQDVVDTVLKQLPMEIPLIPKEAEFTQWIGEVLEFVSGRFLDQISQLISLLEIQRLQIGLFQILISVDLRQTFLLISINIKSFLI